MDRSDVLFFSICISFVVSFVSYVVTIGVGWWFAREIDRENRLMFAGAMVFSMPVLAVVGVLIGASMFYYGNEYLSAAVSRCTAIVIGVIIATAFMFEIAGQLTCMPTALCIATYVAIILHPLPAKIIMCMTMCIATLASFNSPPFFAYRLCPTVLNLILPLELQLDLCSPCWVASYPGYMS